MTIAFSFFFALSIVWWLRAFEDSVTDDERGSFLLGAYGAFILGMMCLVLSFVV